MSILLTSLDSIDPSKVSDYQDELAEIIQNKYPMINLRQGVFRDLVSYLNAAFAAKTSTELDRYRSAQSLLKIEEDPTLADDGVVDGILANYNVTRISGSYSKGSLVVEYNSDVTVFLPQGFEFTALGETFYIEESITIYKSSTTSVLSSTDRILRKMSDGNYGCTIPVLARNIGISSVTRGTVFSVVAPSINIVKVYAAADFSSGKNTETNAELIQRLKSGMATPCWGNRYNIENLIRTKSSLSNIVDISIIGFGNEEMQRDVSKLFPFSSGGKVDVYLKTYPAVTYETITLDAVRGELIEGRQQWQITLPATAFPGSYRVIAVNKPGNTGDVGYTILDQTVLSSRSDLKSEDAGYSIYQSYVVTFETEDIISDESILPFDVIVAGLEGIEDVQSVINNDEYRPVTCDAIAKAAVPAFVDLDVKILEETPGIFTEDIKQEITKNVSEAINNTGFNTVLTGGKIIKIIQNTLGNDGTVYSLNMSAEIWGPTGVDYRTNDTMKLEIPNDPENYVTSNTTAWFARDIAINLV